VQCCNSLRVLQNATLRFATRRLLAPLRTMDFPIRLSSRTDLRIRLSKGVRGGEADGLRNPSYGSARTDWEIHPTVPWTDAEIRPTGDVPGPLEGAGIPPTVNWNSASSWSGADDAGEKRDRRGPATRGSAGRRDWCGANAPT
jgi:hypothetical protein